MSKLQDLINQGKVAAYFDFRKNTLLDLSGNGSVLTPAGVPSWVNGGRGRAVSCTGSGYLSASHVSAQAITSGVHIVFCEPIRVQQANQVFIDKAAGAGTRTLFYITSGTNLALYDGTVVSALATSIIGKRFLAARFASGQKAQFFIDGSYADEGALANGTFTAPTGAMSIGNNAGSKILVAITLNTSTITNQEISQLYDELMSQHGAGDPKTRNHKFDVPKVTDPTLVCHIDGGTKVGATAPDLSGNGNNGNVTSGVVTENHPIFGKAFKANGQTNSATAGGIILGKANVGTLDMGTSDYSFGGWFKYNATTANQFLFSMYSAYPATYFRITGATLLNTRIGFSAGSNVEAAITYPFTVGNWYHVVATFDRDGNMVTYINGVAVDTTDISGIVGQSLSNNQNWKLLGSDAAIYGSEASCKDCRLYKGKVLSATEVANWYKHYAVKLAYQSESSKWLPTLANVTAGELGNTGFKVSTGTWKVSEDSAGKKWVENVAAGVAYMKQDKAYGTFVLEFVKPNASASYHHFISDKNNRNSNNGYSILLNTGGKIAFGPVSSGGESFSTYTADAYIASDTPYKLAITRSHAGVFSFYVKGGAYTQWTLVSMTGGTGTNPTTNTTYTASKFMVSDLDAGDKLRVLGIHEGVLTINELEALY